MTHRDVDEETGLTIRTRNALIRADFGGGEMGEHFHRGPSLHRAKIAAALEDGSILEARLIGRKSINEIREWLARSEPQPNNERGDVMKILSFEYNPDKDEASYRATVEQDGKTVVLEGRFMSVALAEDKTALHAFLERQLAETNLLPCPFCGGLNVKFSLSRDCDYLAVVCMNDECMAEGPSTWPKDIFWDEDAPERAKAVELWNTRAVTLTQIHE